MDLLETSEWEKIEGMLKSKMDHLLQDLDVKKQYQDLAIEALANHKAYKLLQEFLQEISLLKGGDHPKAPRSFA